MNHEDDSGSQQIQRAVGPLPAVDYSRPSTGEPLGGWLLVLGLGFIGGFFASIFELHKEWLDISTHRLAAPWTAHKWYELVCNSVALVLNLVNLLFFTRRKRLFPTIASFSLALLLLLLAVKVLWLTQLPGGIPVLIETGLEKAARAGVAVAWILYLARSRRVRETFVR